MESKEGKMQHLRAMPAHKETPEEAQERKIQALHEKLAAASGDALPADPVHIETDAGRNPGERLKEGATIACSFPSAFVGGRDDRQNDNQDAGRDSNVNLMRERMAARRQVGLGMGASHREEFQGLFQPTSVRKATDWPKVCRAIQRVVILLLAFVLELVLIVGISSLVTWRWIDVQEHGGLLRPMPTIIEEKIDLLEAANPGVHIREHIVYRAIQKLGWPDAFLRDFSWFKNFWTRKAEGAELTPEHLEPEVLPARLNFEGVEQTFINRDVFKEALPGQNKFRADDRELLGRLIYLEARSDINSREAQLAVAKEVFSGDSAANNWGIIPNVGRHVLDPDDLRPHVR